MVRDPDFLFTASGYWALFRRVVWICGPRDGVEPGGGGDEGLAGLQDSAEEGGGRGNLSCC